jgi:uncharacterized protein YdaU (DUF1376 family)
MKQRRPWFPFWIEDFYDEAQHLSFQHQGVLLALMSLAWKQPDAALPNDLKWLRRAVKARGTEPGSVTALSGLLQAFFELRADGKWHHVQLASELEAARNQSESAEKKARKRWGKSKRANGLGDAGAYAAAMPSQHSTAHGEEHEECSSPTTSEQVDEYEDDDLPPLPDNDDEIPF